MKSLFEIARLRSWWWALPPALCGLGLTAFLFILANDRQAWVSYNRWLWFPQWPVFSDLAVTLQHLEEAGRGLDPLTDPTSHFGYPRAALALRHLHLQDLPSAWVGALQALCWMMAVVFILRPQTMRRAIVTGLIFIAPPVWLGLERGNMDLMIFVLCVISAALWARARAATGLLGPVALTAGAALIKIYPVFALVGGAWAETGRRRLVWLAALAAVAIYWVISFEEIKLVLSKFPIGENASWGCLIGLKKMWGQQPMPGDDGIMWAWLMGLGAYVLGFLLAGALGHSLARKFETTRVDRTDWAYYWVGCAICCGSFVASNYAYRWVFALLTLPLLLRMTGATRFLVAVWARATLLALALSLAAPWDDRFQVFLTGQVANWAFILLLVFGCFALRAQHAVPALVAVPDKPDARRLADDRRAEAAGSLGAMPISPSFKPSAVATCSSLKLERPR